jgi:hypothetical protein
MFSDLFRRDGRLPSRCVWLGLRTAEPPVDHVVAAERADVLGVFLLPPITTSGNDEHDRPRLGDLLGPNSNNGGRCFVSLDMSGYVREPRPTKSEGRLRFGAPNPSRGSNQYSCDKYQDTTEDDLEYGSQ